MNIQNANPQQRDTLCGLSLLQCDAKSSVLVSFDLSGTVILFHTWPGPLQEPYATSPNQKCLALRNVRTAVNLTGFVRLKNDVAGVMPPGRPGTCGFDCKLQLCVSTLPNYSTVPYGSYGSRVESQLAGRTSTITPAP